jgi:uncharacterized damage-inducible protein DinB
MITPERTTPPFDADERTTLVTWLDFHRSTLAMKCAGLTEEQLREISVQPSAFSLLGLVQHMAEVERNWFRRVLTGEAVRKIYDPEADPHGPDTGFDLRDDITREGAFATWEAEISIANANVAARELGDTSAFHGAQVSLRWILVHMIEEYARHNGHADLLRERVDGVTGV